MGTPEKIPSLDLNKLSSEKSLLKVTEKPELSEEEIIERRKHTSEREAQANEVSSKYKKGDIFDFSLEKRGETFQIILDGVQVGVFSLRDNGDTKQIGMIMLNKELQHKGFGKQLYVKLNDYFSQTDGSVLMTDTMRVSPEATGLWESLVKEGKAELMEDELTPDDHKVYKFKKF